MSSVVYFIKSETTGLIKIGWTASLSRRVSNLEGSIGERLKVLATVGGGSTLEDHFHQRFASSRAHGEWFSETPDLLDLIGAINLGQYSPPAGMADLPLHNPKTNEAEIVNILAKIILHAGGQRRPSDTKQVFIERAARNIGISAARAEGIHRKEARQVTAAEFISVCYAVAKHGVETEALFTLFDLVVPIQEALIAKYRKRRDEMLSRHPQLAQEFHLSGDDRPLDRGER